MKLLSFVIMLALSFCLLMGCTKQPEWKPCDPVPLIDGFRTFKVANSNWYLRLPSYANYDHIYWSDSVEECTTTEKIIADYSDNYKCNIEDII